MRRALAMAAFAAMMLAAGEPAMTQTPKVQLQQIQPKIQQRNQAPSRLPNMPLIKPGQALMIALRAVPNSKAVGVKLLPGGNYAVTLRQNNRVRRVIVDSDTGALH
jgi:uncharacterized membrane protein YkoI